jgi:hypothetical protein
MKPERCSSAIQIRTETAFLSEFLAREGIFRGPRPGQSGLPMSDKTLTPVRKGGRLKLSLMWQLGLP